jgi:hypothetical protein
MIGAIVLAAFRHAFALFNFAAAAAMSAIFVRHFHHLLSCNLLLSSLSVVTAGRPRDPNLFDGPPPSRTVPVHPLFLHARDRKRLSMFI